MDARCERAVGDLDQHRALRGNFPQSLARLELVGAREHLVLEPAAPVAQSRVDVEQARGRGAAPVMLAAGIDFSKLLADERIEDAATGARAEMGGARNRVDALAFVTRSEEHTSELQSLMRISYAVFCLK